MSPLSEAAAADAIGRLADPRACRRSASTLSGHARQTPGLAIVTTTRRFRNTEESSIEATITFPVPVHATLFDLAARIGERRLITPAHRTSVDRDEYEGAVDAGKTAVLHEEVLRGVHMLSVAHVLPGAEVEVRSTWALTLTNIEGHGHLRIPLTVGVIHGRSPLPDSDDLVHGGRDDRAQLNVDCRDGSVTLHGGELCEGQAKVPLNAPIDLTVSEWTPRTFNGFAADGRSVALRVEPAPEVDRAFDVAILVDHSRSMGEVCSLEGHRETKHQRLHVPPIDGAPVVFVDIRGMNQPLHRRGQAVEIRLLLSGHRSPLPFWCT